MACVVRKGFKVSKPWGDSSACGVGIESGNLILRVQVKSTDCRTQYGLLVPSQAERAQQALHAEADRLSCGVCDSGRCVAFDSGGGFVRGKQKKAVTILPEKPKHPERYK